MLRPEGMNWTLEAQHRLSRVSITQDQVPAQVQNVGATNLLHVV